MDDISNETRAELAQRALMINPDSQNSSPEECLTDLLTNLMHFAQRDVVDFNDCLRLARMHYEAEVEDEEDEDECFTTADLPLDGDPVEFDEDDEGDFDDWPDDFDPEFP
jgi:hypothetical protein